MFDPPPPRTDSLVGSVLKYFSGGNEGEEAAMTGGADAVADTENEAPRDAVSASESAPSSKGWNPGYVELGTIEYVNLTKDGRHGEFQPALDEARRTGKPIFANFVEWSGWQGCKDAGSIFADPDVRRAAEELFVPCAFNTWDRNNGSTNEAMRRWGAGLKDSWWGYLRIVDPGGKVVIAGTGQILGGRQIGQVKDVMREGLEELGMDVPDYLR